MCIHIEQLYSFNMEILSPVVFILECATNLFCYDVMMDFDSDSKECGKSVRRLFKGTKCPYPDDQCSFTGIYRPKLTGKFLVFSTVNDSLYSHSRHETLNAPCTSASLRVSITTTHVYIRTFISTDPHIHIDTKNKNTKEWKNTWTNRNALDVQKIHDEVVFWSFQAFSGYYYTMQYFKLVGQKNNPEQDTVDLYAFRNATAKHCSKTWDQVSGAHQFEMINLIHQKSKRWKIPTKNRP